MESSSALCRAEGDKVSADPSAGNEIMLEPRPEDVVMGRGKRFRCHPGNMRYSALVNDSHERYFSTISQSEKRSIVKKIVDSILEKGRFVKQEVGGGDWVSVAFDQAMTKTSQAIQYRLRMVAGEATACATNVPNTESTIESSDGKSTKPPSLITPLATKKLKAIKTIQIRAPIYLPSASNWFGKIDRPKDNQHEDSYASRETSRPWDQEWKFNESRASNDAYEQSLRTRDTDLGSWDDDSDAQTLQQPVLMDWDSEVDYWPVSEDGINCMASRSHLLDQTTQQLNSHNGTCAEYCCPEAPSPTDGTVTAGPKARQTSLGLFRVSSIGSFVSVDQELDVSMLDMDW